MEAIETLKRYVTEQLLNNKTELTQDDNLLTSGMVDSLGMVRLVEFIEETFNVKVPPEDLTIENFGTINIIADYLQKRAGS